MFKGRFKRSFVACVAGGCLALLAGCATSYYATEPISATDALLVGQIQLVATGFPAAMGANGVYAQNILVTLRSLETGRSYEISSREPDGFISLASPAPGRYAIVGFSARLPAGWGTSQLLRYRPLPPLVLTVRPGVVNNIGTVVWHEDRASRRDWSMAGYGYANVRESFRAHFARSEWDRFRWHANRIGS